MSGDFKMQIDLNNGARINKTFSFNAKTYMRFLELCEQQNKKESEMLNRILYQYCFVDMQTSQPVSSALVKCVQCGSEYASHLGQCPSCATALIKNKEIEAANERMQVLNDQLDKALQKLQSREKWVTEGRATEIEVNEAREAVQKIKDAMAAL